MHRSAAALFLLAAAAALPAAAQTVPKGMDSGDNPADRQFIGALRDQMISMHRSIPTGDTDRDFVQYMLPHDASGVELAKTELQYGKNADLKALAQTIVDDQQKEIALMKAWEDKHPK